MPTQKRQMKLGVSMIGLGYHVAAWRRGAQGSRTRYG
jgi:hypothetical protein